MQLREYQQEAGNAVWSSLKRGRNPCVQLPTGAGKSLVIADVADRVRDRGGYVWIVTHVKELIVQNRKTLDRYSGLEGVGTICAGLNENTEGEFITFGTVQSLYRPASAGGLLRTPDAVIIDECHRVPLGEDGKLYNTILTAFPDTSLIGFTATPWRMDGGVIYGDHPGSWFNDLAYSKSVPEMVELGFLCPLIGVETEIQLDLKGVEKAGGDYVMKQVGDRVTDMWLEAVIKSVQHLAKKRNKIAIYCPTVEAAGLTAKAFSAAGWKSDIVVGGTKNRAEVIDEWKYGDTKVLCSVDVLTTGFDYPALDCIVCLRPTESSSLWCQILGRGTRLYDSKEDCLILDYVGNLARLGGIAMMEDFIVERKGKVDSVRKATGKGPKREQRKPNTLEAHDPMKGKAGDLNVYVNDVSYIVIGSKSQPGKSMVMVCYDCQNEDGYTLSVNDFLCCEYSGYARTKAEAWARRRGASYLPYRSHEALNLCYSLPTPRGLKVTRNGKYWNVLKEYM